MPTPAAALPRKLCHKPLWVPCCKHKWDSRMTLGEKGKQRTQRQKQGAGGGTAGGTTHVWWHSCLFLVSGEAHFLHKSPTPIPAAGPARESPAVKVWDRILAEGFINLR